MKNNIELVMSCHGGAFSSKVVEFLGRILGEINEFVIFDTEHTFRSKQRLTDSFSLEPSYAPHLVGGTKEHKLFRNHVLTISKNFTKKIKISVEGYTDIWDNKNLVKIVIYVRDMEKSLKGEINLVISFAYEMIIVSDSREYVFKYYKPVDTGEILAPVHK